jgi:uncharacterized membrane protein YhaH (DUF805 family)
MLEALFSFSGRIDRSDFIRWSAFQAGLSALMLAGIEGFSVETLSALKAGSTMKAQMPNISIMLVLGVALVIFPSSALLIKRLRDVGVPAWPCFTVIALIDALMSGVVPHTTGFAEGPFAGLSFSIAVTVLLAFVPGRSGTVAEEAAADWVERAAIAERRLLEDRRKQTTPSSEEARLAQLQSLEALRQTALAGGSAPQQKFGRRSTDRH